MIQVLNPYFGYPLCISLIIFLYSGYKHRIIDKLINEFFIFFTNSKLHTFIFLILLDQSPLHH